MIMIEFLSQPWPWYVAGPLIGLTVPLLLLFGNKPFGLSSSFKHICAAVLPLKISYLNYNWKDEIWSLFFLFGSLLGGWIGTTLLADQSLSGLSDTLSKTFSEAGPALSNGLAPAALFSIDNLLSVNGFIFVVVGGFFVGFGTRYAEGCTSGHAISGLSNFQFASLIAVVGFFIGGLFITHLVIPVLLGGSL
jgi:uncharacterized membrane protein YedE/YeeE